MEKKEKRFALLIDADNISAKYIKPILDELSQYGNITYKRIYGDWTSTLHASWKEELLANSITPIQQFSYTDGFSNDYRCHGYPLHQPGGRLLYRLQ